MTKYSTKMFLYFISLCSFLIIYSAHAIAENSTIIRPENSFVPDENFFDKEGNKVFLDQFEGKTILLSFWASWCGPCRRENPNVVEAYTKYHKSKFLKEKGFEVYSVSLDRDEKAWKEAIKTDKLIWKYHGWDKEGKASAAYNVSSIPSGFLIDGEGKIIAQGEKLRGMNLHLAIEKQIK